MDIILEKVEECKRDVLYRLLQYSLFEESLSDQNDMNEEALFEYPWFHIPSVCLRVHEPEPCNRCSLEISTHCKAGIPCRDLNGPG